MSQRALMALATPAARFCILSFSHHSDGWASFPPRWWVFLLDAVSVSVSFLDTCKRIRLCCHLARIFKAFIVICTECRIGASVKNRTFYIINIYTYNDSFCYTILKWTSSIWNWNSFPNISTVAQVWDGHVSHWRTAALFPELGGEARMSRAAATGSAQRSVGAALWQLIAFSPCARPVQPPSHWWERKERWEPRCMNRPQASRWEVTQCWVGERERKKRTLTSRWENISPTD